MSKIKFLKNENVRRYKESKAIKFEIFLCKYLKVFDGDNIKKIKYVIKLN